MYVSHVCVFFIFLSVSCRCSSMVAMEKAVVRKSIRRLKVLSASGTEITAQPASLYALPFTCWPPVWHCQCWRGAGLRRYLKHLTGAPGWLSRLSLRLQLRSWCHGSWVQAPSQALCWQLGAWSLLQILGLRLSLPLACSHSVSLSLSLLKNK